MWHTLRALLIPLFLALPAFAQAWNEYAPAGAGFRIELPEAPKLMTRDVSTAAGPAKATIAYVDRGMIAFLAGFSDHSADDIARRSAEGVLDDVVRGQTGQNKLRKQRSITVSDRPGREAIIDDARGQVIVIHTVLVETRLFQAIYVGPNGSETGADALKFLGSFAIVPR